MVYAARHPDQVSHLIPWCTYAQGEEYWRSTQSEGFRVLRQTNYPMFLRTAAHELLGWADDEDADRFADLMRLAVDPVEADQLIAATHSFNASDALPHIECPTVVLHRRDLHWLDIGLSRDVASRIPGAPLTIVDGHSPLPATGEASAVTTAIAEILGLAPAERNSGDFRVVLFTDLVDHTHMMSDLGDRRGRELLREHETITREVLREHGATEVKTLGDGFMASFTRITDALGCAVNLQQRFTRRNARVASLDEPPLKVRIGINAGEPIEEDGDLFGATVILAARIASAAQGDEVLVSNAVRELSAGNDFIFRNRGSFDAKGFDESFQIWEVAWTP